MKFRFCNDLDCPDWVLSEIVTSTKMSSVKLKMLCVLIAKQICDAENLSIEKVEKLTSDISKDKNSMKGIIAVLEFIMTTAAKNECSSGDLCQELEQLGMPVEHSQALSKVYGDYMPQMTTKFSRSTFKLPSLRVVSSSIKEFPKGQTRQFFTQLLIEQNDGTVQRQKNIYILPDKLDCLITELKTAASIMDQYSDS